MSKPAFRWPGPGVRESCRDPMSKPAFRWPGPGVRESRRDPIETGPPICRGLVPPKRKSNTGGKPLQSERPEKMRRASSASAESIGTASDSVVSTTRTMDRFRVKTFLLSMQLHEYRHLFDRLGVKSPRDLVYVRDADLQHMGMNTDQQQTFHRGVATLKTTHVTEDGLHNPDEVGGLEGKQQNPGAACSHASHAADDEFRKASRARMFPCGVVPSFSPKANGSPFHWNKVVQTWNWGRKARGNFQESDRDPDVSRVLEFLSVRKGADGSPVAEKLGGPKPMGNGWVRLPWKAFKERNLPRKSQGAYARNGCAEWTRAWHGCKFEALYSIAYHGELFESNDKSQGHQFLDVAPGVYVHKDKGSAKGYARFVPLCGDSIFWRALWEVRVDRADRMSMGGKRRDQWVQKGRSVKLAALWLQGCNTGQMNEQDELSSHWDPHLEAHPLQHRTM